MKLEYDRLKKEVVQIEETEGLIKAVYRHKVGETQAFLDYTGPKLSPELWAQIVGFMEWSYAEHKSEAQLRLYVDLEDKQWVAWAFPQEIEAHGLHSKEVSGIAFDKQREELPHAQNLIPYGTVHHPCGIGASQSGTDHADESNQDGLHITIGNMDKPEHDIHARIAMNGTCYKVDLSAFWDIGQISGNIPPNLGPVIAEYQMLHTKPSTDFPEQWKKNMVKERPFSHIYSGMGTYAHDWQGANGWSSGSKKDEKEERAKLLEKAARKVYGQWFNKDVLVDHMQSLEQNVLFGALCDECEEHGLLMHELYDWLKDIIIEPETTVDAASGAVTTVVKVDDEWRPEYDGNNSEGKPLYRACKGSVKDARDFLTWDGCKEHAAKLNEEDMREIYRQAYD